MLPEIGCLIQKPDIKNIITEAVSAAINSLKEENKRLGEENAELKK